MKFSASKRLDVIITITKHVQCNVLFYVPQVSKY